MNKFILILILFLITSCANKSKTVLICGDHICINKKEAEQYFEENLTIEIKIINQNNKKDIDLVELNMNRSSNEKKIVLKKKENTTKSIKKLSSEEKNKIKKSLKQKEKRKKLTLKKNDKIKLNSVKDKSKIKKDFEKKIVKRDLRNNNGGIKDICAIIDNCSIEEISKYLINEGKKKKFPDITLRQ